MSAIIGQPVSSSSAKESLSGRFLEDRMDQLRGDGAEMYRLRQGGASEGDGGGAYGGMLNSHWTVIEKPLTEEDTLASLSLRYNCSIDELKRLNRIMRDQELFALRTVRIPVMRHGVLEERLTQEGRERLEAYMLKERRRTGSSSETDYAISDDEITASLSSSRLKLLSHSTPHPTPPPSQISEYPEITRLFQSADDEIRSVTESLLAGQNGTESGLWYSRRVRGHSQEGMACFGGYLSSRTVILMVVAIGAGVPLFYGLLILVNNLNNWT